MIQTQLIKALQATPADGTALGGALGGDGADLPLPGEGKAVFAEAMARAQQAGKESQTDRLAIPVAPATDAKSLAIDGEGIPAGQESPDEAIGDKYDKGEPPSDDFLQQLQASLRQDVSLVVPLSPPLSQPIAPPSAQPAVTAPIATDGNDLPPESRPTSSVEAGKAPTVAAQPGLPPRLGADAPQPSTQPSETGETDVAGDADSTGKSIQGADKGASLPAPRVPMTALPTAAMSGDVPVTLKEEGESSADPEAKPSPTETARAPLFSQERAALLASPVPHHQAAAKGHEVLVDKGDKKPALAATSVQVVQASATQAFDEGLSKVEPGTEAGEDGKARLASQVVASAGDVQPAATAGAEVKAAQTPVARSEPQQGNTDQGAVKSEQGTVQAAGTTLATSPVTEPSPEPALAAPQQILARHESQGPQASLTALSAGIQQMEAEPVLVVKTAVDLKQVDGESRLDKLGKTPGTELKEPERGESTPSPQQVQAPVNDSKPAAELGARREPQSLPHLKLATPEAPEQLHQKVNLMLADRLQQAEIQLDPLGLGKMKIQIQMGSDSQANVNFVVQHGQTRELLEQAMPRLREMLAGQGIQLGQTQVQQQSQQQAQQQAQGQSAFTGQEQRGQQGGGAFAGRGQGEEEPGARSLSLLAASPNDGGIDFYA